MAESMRAGGCEWFPDGSRVQYTRCQDCMWDNCPGGWHQWADRDDIAHALLTGQPDPSGQVCGCDCVLGDPLDTEPPLDPEVDDQLGTCPVCGSDAACGYDTEGRPLIHAYEGDE